MIKRKPKILFLFTLASGIMCASSLVSFLVIYSSLSKNDSNLDSILNSNYNLISQLNSTSSSLISAESTINSLLDTSLKDKAFKDLSGEELEKVIDEMKRINVYNISTTNAIDNIRIEYKRIGVSNDNVTKLKRCIEEFYTTIYELNPTSDLNDDVENLRSIIKNSYNESLKLIDIIKAEQESLLLENANSIHATSKKTEISIILIHFFSISVSVLMFIFILKYMKNGINRVTTHLSHISSGDLSENIEIDENSQNEFDLIVKDISVVKNNIRRALEDISKNYIILDNQSHSILQSSSDMAYSVSNILESMNQINEGATLQSTSLVDVVNKLSCFEENLNNGKSDIVNITTDSESISKNVKISGNELSKIENTISSLKTSFNEVTEQISVLTNDLEQITVIINNINDIADKTNLLALNASIEAARAGEQGRGFSVVASEIKTLSEQTKLFASNIAAILDSVQKQSQITTKTTRDADLVLSEGIDITSNTVTMLSSVLDDVRNVMDRFASVNNIITDVTNDAQNISETIQTISSVSEENTAYSEEISANIERLNVISSEFKDACEDSISLSSNVRESIDNFKLK